MTSRAAIEGTVDPARAQRRSQLLARFISRRLAGATAGRLLVVLPSGERLVQDGHESGPRAKLIVRRWRALARLVLGGDLGFANGYIAGDWSSPNLGAFLEWGACNAEALERAFTGSGISKLADRLRHLARANTRRGSRRNISEHYDLGNAFYRLWLDAGMNYSSGLYSQAGQTLEDAQHAKILRAAQLLQLKGGERVLEIGCGWGAMADHLSAAHGCSVRGLTLSTEQRDFARRRLEAIGAGAHSDIRLQDYRDERGQYDRVVSIEMLEAVGEAYWPLFFAKLRACLKPGGIAVVQSISIAEERFEAYRQHPDFIQRHVFPGGMLPTIALIRQHVERAGLHLIAMETFGASYAATLAEWRARFLRSWPLAQALGFDESFKRKWEYYLAYCEAGFRSGVLDVGLYALVNPPREEAGA